MSIISTYSVSTASNITLSTYYSSIDDLLLGLPDNVTNAIKASNVRDAVYTLYQYTNTLVASASVTASVSAAVSYNRLTPSTNQLSVGGVGSGSTFSGTIQDALDKVFYSYVAPSASLSSPSDREFGAFTSVVLNWSVVKNSNPIVSPIVVQGNNIMATGNNQSGSVPVFGTYSSTPGVSEVNVFSMTVTDGTTPTTSTVSLTWMNRIYWGSVDLSGIGNPNLTFFPGSASIVASVLTDAVIWNLNGANANGSVLGSQLSTTKYKVYNGIDGAGEYLVFAWPSNVVDSPFTPNFTVNGNHNTAFTRVRNNSPLSNQYGFSTNYEVWVSNTRQNSPLNIIIS